MTDLFSAMADWNIILRQAGWIVLALIQVSILNRGTITRAKVIERCQWTVKENSKRLA
jgi:hypothetical protein